MSKGLPRSIERVVDISILVAIPALLTSIHFLLPASVYENLVFTFDNANPVTAWTTAYLHESPRHLYDNLAGYATAIGFTYYLYAAELQRRRLFWTTVAVLLAVTPFVTTAIDYIILYQYAGLLAASGTSVGFSGIVSAFGGMLFAGIGGFVAAEYDAWDALHTVLLITLAALGALTTINSILTPTIAVLLSIGFILLGVQLVPAAVIRSPAQRSNYLRQHAGTATTVVVCGTVVCVLVVGMLPLNVVQNGSFVNILAHTTGFIFGAGVAHLLLLR